MVRSLRRRVRSSGGEEAAPRARRRTRTRGTAARNPGSKDGGGSAPGWESTGGSRGSTPTANHAAPETAGKKQQSNDSLSSLHVRNSSRFGKFAAAGELWQLQDHDHGAPRRQRQEVQRGGLPGEDHDRRGVHPGLGNQVLELRGEDSGQSKGVVFGGCD
jgi:hypothetical protein